MTPRFKTGRLFWFGFWTLAAGQGFMRGGDLKKLLRMKLKPKPCEDTMSIILYAQPYNIDAEGFYFRSAAEYAKLAASLTDRYGNAVEEFEIQMIEADDIDCELAKAWDLSQCNFAAYLDATDKWSDDEKTAVIIAVGECGYNLDPQSIDPNDFDVQLFELDSMRDLAIEFVEDGVLGDIPKALQYYVDYDAFARDLAVDYSECAQRDCDVGQLCRRPRASSLHVLPGDSGGLRHDHVMDSLAVPTFVLEINLVGHRSTSIPTFAHWINGVRKEVQLHVCNRTGGRFQGQATNFR